MKLLKLITSFIIFISFSAVANQDVSGSKDHPLLSRYPDTHIIQYAESEYDEFDLPSGPNDEEKDYPKVINLEGKITTITYEANNTKTSSLQILKNYQNALNKAGFKEIYTCESKNDNCGNNFKSDFYYKAPQRNNYDRFWGNTSDNKFFFYSGVLEQEDNKTYVAIGTFKSDSDDETMIVVDVVEITTMKEDLIKVSKDFKTSNIKNSNHVYKDEENSTDHPLLSRYPDTHIIQYAESEYDEFDLPSGPNDEEKDYPKVINLEGKITTITYEANNTKTSSLQILKNYQNALNKAGFKEIYTCESKNDNCGNNFKSDFYYKAPQRNNYDRFWGNTSDNKFFFYSGVLEQEDNKTYVAIGTFKSDSDDETMIVVDVVEITTMKEDLIQTSDFSSAIGKYGKATLSGVLFDTGQASIKKESQQAIEYISNFLSKNPTINVFIVGHTDNTHTYDNNLKLSQQRAAAVVDSLIKKGIKKDRMKSVGIGPVSPVSTNATENGRALNRRVEMVLIK